MPRELYNIPGKVVGHYHPDMKTIIDTWDSLLISLEDWKASVYEVGICDFAPKNGVKVWIIGTSKGQGVFKQEVQEFREQVARPKLVQNGVEYLFVVLPQSALGKLSARKTANLYDGDGTLHGYQVASVEEARKILKDEGVI